MNKSRALVILWRINQILKIGVIAATILFGVIFVMLFSWEVKLPGTVPESLVYVLIVVTLLPYALAAAYEINRIIIKIYTKKKKQR